MSVGKLAGIFGLALLAACGPKAPPVIAPPPPVKAEAIPYRPLPPGGAAYMMSLPGVGADGARVTVNTGLNEDETLWHFRSGWNVAALNCMDPRHQPIVDGYSAFLKLNARTLTAANNALDNAYRKQAGSKSKAIRAREEHLTQVYNYFALPPARSEFCNTALAVANDALANPPQDAHLFAASNLPRIEAAFQNFFNAYERYQTESAAWDAQYGSRYGASQPGYVAVHGAAGYAPSAMSSSGVITAGSYATPVVQPLPNDVN